MENVIEIKNLKKSFGEVRAVDDLSFSVRKGELYAFLGVNGAGKSTTISMICGRLAKDSGEVSVCGMDPTRDMGGVSRQIGVVFQNSVLDMPLTVRDNLRSRAALYGINGKEFEKRLESLSNLLEFSDLLGRTVGKLSGGQRRRIDIARALIHSPKLLILDEPTTGLDPQTRKLLWDVVRKLRREDGMTVLLTTHYMEEAADADYVLIIDSGHAVAEGTPLQLKNAYTGDFVTVYGADGESIKALGLPYEKLRDAFRVSVPDTAAAAELILANPGLFTDFEVTKGRMDDVFLAATGKKAGLDGGEAK